jgi:RNA polymerase sigma-70 factor (ECF subfamily)
MTMPRADLVAAFEGCRADLVALAYRMLGDMARAEDMAQEAWLRWSRHAEEAVSPRAYLVTVVTRLCLKELDSARMRREESREDRLPEPVAVEDTSLERLEELDQVSMALLFVLQRLKPAERAVLLLHDVFDFDHAAIAELVGKSPVACRKLLERARQSVAEERRSMAASQDEHRRLLRAFLAAAGAGDTASLAALLADDAMLVSDGGSGGVAVGGFRNLARPLHGSARIAAFVTRATRRGGGTLRQEERQLNGRPAVVFFRGEQPFAALLLAVSDGKIQRVFFHADTSRLRYLGGQGAWSLQAPDRQARRASSAGGGRMVQGNWARRRK